MRGSYIKSGPNKVTGSSGSFANPVLTVSEPRQILTRTVSHFLLIVVLLGLKLQAEPTVGFEDWKIGIQGNVTFISNADDSDIQDVIHDVSLYKQGIREFLDVPETGEEWPLRIFICRDSETFRFISPEEDKFEKKVAGFFTKGLGYDSIIIKADASRQQVRNIIYHELTHRLMKQYRDLPLWLEEGYAECYGGFEARGKRLRLGIPQDSHTHWIRKNGVMPLSRLFHVAHHSPEYNENNLSTAFYSTSWAFVHMGTFSEDLSFRKAFEQFAAKAGEQPVSFELFKSCFGMGYEEMEEKIERYARQFRHPIREIRLSRPIVTQTVPLRNLSDKACKTYLAGALVLANRYDTAAELMAENRDAIESIPPPGDHAFQSYLTFLSEEVHLHYRQYAFEKAQLLAEQAYALGSRDPAVLLVLTEKILVATPGQVITYDIYVPNALLNLAVSCINELLSLDNRRSEVWRLYALVWLRTDVEPGTQQLNKIYTGCRLLPDDQKLHFLVSDLLVFLDRRHEARNLLQRFIDHTTDARDKREAQVRLNRLH